MASGSVFHSKSEEIRQHNSSALPAALLMHASSSC